MYITIQTAKETYKRVNLKLRMLKEIDPAFASKILQENGYSGQFWSLKLDIAESFKDNFKLSFNELSFFESELNTKFPECYKHYLTQIANGGIGGWTVPIISLNSKLIAQQELEESVNFPTMKTYNMPFKEDDYAKWLETYNGGLNLVFSQIDNGDEIFIVLEGHLPGSVWWYHCDDLQIKPLAANFIDFLYKNLNHTEKMIDILNDFITDL